MPYYGIHLDQTSENVGFSFNKEIITDLLRDSLDFNGVVCTDWNIITNSGLGAPRAWGVENLMDIEKVQKVLDAGCDQFGGEYIPELIVELVVSGKISESRINTSVRRILRDKFRLGLFENPFVDQTQALIISGNKDFIQKGMEAQKQSIVLLKNDKMLPLKKGKKLYVEGFTQHELFDDFGELVSDVNDAEIIIKRIKTPYEERNEYFLENFFRQGRLYYSKEENKKIFSLINKKPSIVIVNLERPAILTDIDARSHSLLAEFGSSDRAIIDVIFGRFNPSGKLPFELPSSQKAVENQKEDVPYDSKDPLYPYGHGLTY